MLINNQKGIGISHNHIAIINTFWKKRRKSNIEDSPTVNNVPSFAWYSPFDNSLFWKNKVSDLIYFYILFSQKSELSKGEYQANEGSLLTVCEPSIFDILLLI